MHMQIGILKVSNVTRHQVLITYGIEVQRVKKTMLRIIKIRYIIRTAILKYIKP